MGVGVDVEGGLGDGVGAAATVAAKAAVTVASTSGAGAGVTFGNALATAASTLAWMSGVGSGARDVHAATAAAKKAESTIPMPIYRATSRIGGFYRANGHVFAPSLQEAGLLRGVESENLFHKLETCGNPRLQIPVFMGMTDLAPYYVLMGGMMS